MPDYRFTDPVRQTNFVEFGLSIGQVCEHLKAWNFQITSIALKANRLTITVNNTIPAGELPHMGLQAG